MHPGNQSDPCGTHPKDAPPYKHLSPTGQTIVTTSYVIGIAGTVAALYILHKAKKTKYRNRKHALMLRCLMGNDLVALLGMLVQMYIQLYFPKQTQSSRLSCVIRVLWKVFGLGSGCVAIVMAVERWLALTHPFFYQKKVTYKRIQMAILCLWSAALVLVCAPFIGFGLYFDEVDTGGYRCIRYRYATEPIDIAYAYVYFVFGIVLLIGIICANLSVTRTLCHPRLRQCRRITRSLSRANTHPESLVNACTPEEQAFARLMVAFSISFLVCWLPQMLTIPIAQLWHEYCFSRYVYTAGDFLMAIHFTLDPYIYVLLHHRFPCLRITFELVNRHCCCWTDDSQGLRGLKGLKGDSEQSSRFIAQ